MAVNRRVLSALCLLFHQQGTETFKSARGTVRPFRGSTPGYQFILATKRESLLLPPASYNVLDLKLVRHPRVELGCPNGPGFLRTLCLPFHQQRTENFDRVLDH